MKKSSLQYLDSLNKAQDLEAFKNAFHRFLVQNEKEAINYLNDKRLYFPTLFFVCSELETLGTKSKLNNRNRIALDLCNVINEQKGLKEINKKYGAQKVHETLNWMFDTGVYADSLSDKYDNIIDGTVGLLICSFKDFSILPSAITLMFRRYERDYLIHDLAWYIFQSKDPCIMPLIANYLQSQNQKSIQLASKLLHSNTDLNDININQEEQRADVKKSIEDNLPYIYFTGESLQLSSEPNTYEIQLEGKYLNKKVSHDTGKLLKPLKKFEQAKLEEFRQKDMEEKKQLSNYSCKLRERDSLLWRKWIKKDLSTQLVILQNDLEEEL